MTDTPTLMPESADPDIAPESALSRIAQTLRPEMEAMTKQVVHQIQESVPEYAGPEDAPRHQKLTAAAQAAAQQFLDDAEQVTGRAHPVEEMFRRFGYAQARRGRQLESLDAAMRAATRWSWHYLAEFAVAKGLSGSDLRDLADAVFDYLEHLNDLLAEGFKLKQRVGDHERNSARARLLELFRTDPPPRPGADAASSIDPHVLRGLAEAAEWPIPERVVALAVSYYGEPPDIPESSGRLIHVEPRRALVVCPASEQDELADLIGRSAPGVRVAISWPMAPTEAGAAVRWCQRALDLVQIGVLPPTPIVRCDEHTTQLWLHAEPTMRRYLCQKLLQPLLAETPNSRSILSETLLTWVETHDSAPAIAARLDVHPQTVRYRWKRINEIFGESLQDPDFVAQILLVLKASLPLWQAGDQSDFDLFHDRTDAPMNRLGTHGLFVLIALGDIVLAGGTWLGWTAAGHSGLHAALAVLIVATPAGQILARLLPLWVARRVGRSRSITHLELTHDARSQAGRLVIESRRVLTTGDLVVTNVTAFDPDNDRNLRWFAGALSHNSVNPVNRAIAHLAGTGRTTGVAEDPEHGIGGSVDRHPVRIGQAGWLGGDWPVDETPDPIGVTVGVEVDQRPMGRITVADEVRRDATHHLTALRDAGVDPVLVSSGTNPDLARIAQLCGAEEWYAGADVSTIADKLGADGTGTVRVLPSGDAEVLLPDARATTTDPSIGTVVGALGLLRRTRQARHRSLRLAWLLWLLPIPFAALGLVPPLLAAVVAIITWVVIATTASWEFAGIRVPAEPEEA